MGDGVGVGDGLGAAGAPPWSGGDEGARVVVAAGGGRSPATVGMGRTRGIVTDSPARSVPAEPVRPRVTVPAGSPSASEPDPAT